MEKKNTIYVAIISSDIHANIYKAYKSRYDAVDITATSIFDSRSEARDNLKKYGFHYNGRSTACEIATLEYNGGNDKSVHLIATLNSKGTEYKAFASKQEAYDFVFKTMAQIKGDSDLGEHKDIAAKRLDEGKEVEYGYLEGDTHCFTYVKVEVIR